jgi:hypothetical protein
MTATGASGASVDKTVMTFGQLPNNMPTEKPPYRGVESPHWVSPSRPLFGIQIINDYGEVVFEANQRDGLLVPAPIGATGATGAGTALLGTNCPATTATTPYIWIEATAPDGTTVWIPAWK